MDPIRKKEKGNGKIPFGLKEKSTDIALFSARPCPDFSNFISDFESDFLSYC